MIYTEVCILASVYNNHKKNTEFGGWTSPPDDKDLSQLVRLYVPMGQVEVLRENMVLVKQAS